MMLRTSLGRVALALFAGLALASSALAQTGTIGRAPATGGLPGTYAVGDLLAANSTTTLARIAAPAVGQVLKSNGVGVAPSWSGDVVVASVGPTSGNDLILKGASVGAAWKINPSGMFVPQVANTYDIGSAAVPVRTLHIAASTSFSDLQAGGGVRFGTGVVLGSAGANQFAVGDSTGATRLFTSTSATGYFQVDTAQFIGWGAVAGQAYNGGDLRLYRGAAGSLEQRNGANDQRSLIYNTYTDAANFERGIFGFSSNVLYIGTQKAGTGSDRNIAVIIGGATKLDYGITTGASWTMNSPLKVTGNIISDGTIYPSGAAKGIFSSPADSQFKFADNANANSVTITAGSGNLATFNGPIQATNLLMGSANRLGWASRTRILSSVDGNLTLYNNLSTDFGLLQFGGVSDLFAALKRNGANLEAKLADDSAFTGIKGKLTTDTAYTAGDPTTTGYLVVYDSTGTAYRVPALLN